MNTEHPMQARQSGQDYFQSVLVTVVGGAFAAAGYHLAEEPMQWLGGRYRFIKPLAGNWRAIIEFQVLTYTDNAYTGQQPSRFRVTLIRSDQPGGKPSSQPGYVHRTLSQLVVSDFGVAILPSPDHWWPFSDTTSLGNALAEAGHLAVGYGIPWLQGDLSPDGTNANGSDESSA
ncbi:MAG: hypothetical protein KC708_15885 [Anaerolineae bacterium]|nr:hypothetical protein [Anaerolineae bacterium]